MTAEIERAHLGVVGEELGHGGQARVLSLPELRLPDAPGPLVYKEYRSGQVTPHGLGSIVALRQGLPPNRRAELDACTSWPFRVVRDGGNVSGVLLPLIPDAFFQRRTLPSGQADRSPREVQNLFVDPDLAAQLGMLLMPLTRRLGVCRDLAAALAVLHRLGVVFGDVNAKNVLFRVADAATVMLIDWDAVRVRGSSAVVRQLNSPDWDPPEGDLLSQTTDANKLGLFIGRVLSPGPQSSVSRDPRRARPLLDQGGRMLLDLALGPNPAERPGPGQWAAYFTERLASLQAEAAYRALESS